MIVASLLFAFLFTGDTFASHILKRRHFPHHRSQCRPRLTSSTEELQPVTTLSAPLFNTTPGHSSSSVFIPTSEHHTSPTPHTTFSPTFVHSTSAPLTTSSSSVAPSAETSSTVVESTSISTITTRSTDSSATPLSTSLIPNNIKAGIAGGDAYPYMKDHIGWWYDWSPDPSKPGSPIAVPMLWGDGSVDKQDAQRLVAFENLATVPTYVLGFEEPDCPSGSGSADMSVEDGVAKWESLIAPLKKKGTKLGSPSMCKQADETWLAEFSKLISTPWDFTAVHINKNSLDGVKKDVDHYLTYGKPLWITEFACVDDYEKFVPCTDQDEINAFIRDVVPYFEGNKDIYAYAYSNGLGLGDVWPLMNGDSLSESGKTYLAAISEYH
ncbi:hypothetical protein CPC08DRAFT_187244 [Agrocybe pediades]|nr:hypothetical protein CPC08DRAFT_187244 [Agrocybe pediades]